MAENQAANLYEGVPFEEILKCVHCGLCLEACPTYRVLGLEQDSPRGRLYLMRGLWEGELEAEPAVFAPLERCLDCRACETACPSGVPYGSLLEKTRGAVAKRAKRSWSQRLVRHFLLNRVLPSRRWLTSLSWMGRLSAKLGLPKLARHPICTKLIPEIAVRGSALMPDFEGSSFKRKHQEPLRPSGEVRFKVALFSGCIMDVANHEIHQATLDLLLAAGCEVQMPQAQTCCGALAVHAGERSGPRLLAERNFAAFAGLDRLIVNAAGCGAQLKEYAELFAETASPQSQKWHQFGKKVVDLLGFLGQTGIAAETQLWRAEPEQVFYDAPCHLQHAMKAGAPAQALLKAIPGISLVPLIDADHCCGAAGVYNMVQGSLSDQILARKMDGLVEQLAKYPDAKVLLTANPGCLYQLRKGCCDRQVPLKVLHPAVFLARRLAKNSH